MNIFEIYLEKIKKVVNENQKKLNLKDLNNLKSVNIEIPPNKFGNDLSTNLCMVLGKSNSLKPDDLSKKIKPLLLNKINDFEKISIAGPGFLNINLSKEALKKIISNIFKESETFGSQKSNSSYNIEFVSANPTGPMHIGHCRGAIFGDVLSNLLKFNGNKVTKEYYINDYGEQIKNFVKSVYLRIREIKFKEKFISEKDLYPGEYIKDIAKKIISENNFDLDNFENNFESLKISSLKYSMHLIKEDLEKLGISHDNFVSEKSIVDKNTIAKAIKELKTLDYVEEGYLEPPKGEDQKNWKKTKRLIFKSTMFGDDSNRSLQKIDGSWTYFANDVAYHYNKLSRKYDKLINILGADHTGYIKRIKGAVLALSKNKIELECKVCQLVKLFKKGSPFKMSKRAGEFISVNDLLSEVNKDSIRFMMLNRSNDVELDFDFDKVLEKNKENPVFYVQYCHARIQSILRIINHTPDKNKLNIDNISFNKYEMEILRKIFEWPKIIKISSDKYEPHRIPFYLYELSTLFHSYWSKGNEEQKYRFIEGKKIKNNNILLIIKLILIVLKNGMKILNVSLPNKM
tara:strand:+ start:209 stop:1927 length:1719 start_codon:yes stop_codon:yes gene_type:complete